MKNTLLICVFGFLLISFSSLEIKAQSPPLQNGEIPKDLVISLERTFNCFDVSDYISGKCRDYSLKINANGNVALTLEETHKRKTKNINTKLNDSALEVQRFHVD